MWIFGRRGFAGRLGGWVVKEVATAEFVVLDGRREVELLQFLRVSRSHFHWTL
jgi:hypothetical protein